MDMELIFFKTEKGKDEIEHRTCGLPFKQRRVLILVDGEATVAELQAKSAGVPGLMEALEDLQRRGFVQAVGSDVPAASAVDSAVPVGAATDSTPAPEPEPAPRSGNGRERLINLAGEILGPSAAKVTRKLREAPDSPEALVACLESCRKIVKLTIDEGKAEELYRRGRALLP
ncbi:hypothetical protein BMS3Abin12_01334 [bacterium BMS3Abin12]|nr:hypothetical protein BMS3Abin12_01334 [bacterium BMS3Abin12]